MYKVITTLLVVASIAACSSSSDSLPQPESRVTPPPVAAKTNFTRFVKQQLANSDVNAEPVDINGIDFEFTDLDDPDAYDDVIEGTR